MMGRSQPRARRWAVSFADLSLLIACTLMLGWRPGAADPQRAQAAVEASLLELPTAALFVDGEAMLSDAAVDALAAARAAIASGERVKLSVGAGTAGSARLDAWELAAARTAALARQLGAAQVQLSAPTGDRHVRISRLP